MENLTENFTLEELIHSDTADKKKIKNEPNEEQKNNLKKLAETVLQPIRDKWEAPITVTSGFRSKELNTVLKGAKTSQHLNGEAADIKVSNNKKLWDLITEMIENKEIEVGQLIDECNLSWIHISLPNNKHKNQILKLK